MNKIFLNRMYIWTFLVLYMVTALISCIHAIDFFSIGNVKWMAIALAMVFEVGQAMVLSSLLLSNNRNNIMPWCLMIILTSVQVIGNVYSCFSFIAKSGTDYYQYLQKPLLFWIEGVSQETMMIIISWIIGALLPIIALCMTTMVTNNIELSDNKDLIKIKSIILSIIGGLFGVIIYYTTPTMIFCVENIWTALLIGIISGASSSGANALIKQIFK